MEKIEEIIENAFELDEALTEYEMKERLEEVLGNDYVVKQQDSWIDDGCEEDEEDEYVMGVLFSIQDTKTNDSVDVRIYYGDVTGKIGWVKID